MGCRRFDARSLSLTQRADHTAVLSCDSPVGASGRSSPRGSQATRSSRWALGAMRRATCGRQLLRNCCGDRFDPQPNRGYRFDGEASFGSALAGKCSRSVVPVRGFERLERRIWRGCGVIRGRFAATTPERDQSRLRAGHSPRASVPWKVVSRERFTTVAGCRVVRPLLRPRQFHAEEGL